MNPLFRFGRFCFRHYFKWRYRLREINVGALPVRGGIILASNHASYYDPPLIGSCILKREISFMARSTLFTHPVFGWILRRVHAYPIVRGQGPDQDWDMFLNHLNRGEALLVFPEGTRTPDGQLQRGKTGFGRLVRLSRKPVYPLYVQGTYEAFPRSGAGRVVPITVYFGEPVPMDDLLALPPDKKVEREISDRTMAAIARLRDQALARTAGA